MITISRWRLAAILTGRSFPSGCGAVATCGLLWWQSLVWFRALLTEAWYMPHTEQQRLLSCGSTDQRRIQEGGGVVTEISEAHRPYFSWEGGRPHSKTNETSCTDLLLGVQTTPYQVSLESNYLDPLHAGGGGVVQHEPPPPMIRYCGRAVQIAWHTQAPHIKHRHDNFYPPSSSSKHRPPLGLGLTLLLLLLSVMVSPLSTPTD